MEGPWQSISREILQFNVKSLTFEHVEYPPPRLFNVSSPILPETMIEFPLESDPGFGTYK